MPSPERQIIPPGPNSSQSSVEPASAKAGYLVMRAMAFFESNRDVAWRCLRDASSLLGGESDAIGNFAPPLRSILRGGGLAAWQAKRILEYIQDNLASKMVMRDMADLVALSPSQVRTPSRWLNANQAVDPEW